MTPTPCPSESPPATVRTWAQTQPPGPWEGSKVASAARSVAEKASPGSCVPSGLPSSLGCWSLRPLPTCSLKGVGREPASQGILGVRTRGGGPRVSKPPSPWPARVRWTQRWWLGSGVGEGGGAWEPTASATVSGHSALAHLQGLSSAKHPVHAAAHTSVCTFVFVGPCPPPMSSTPGYLAAPCFTCVVNSGGQGGPGDRWGPGAYLSECQYTGYEVCRYMRCMGIGVHKVYGCGVCRGMKV